MAKQQSKKKASTTEYLTPEALMAEVNSKFGANTLVRASEAVGLIKDRCSTGSFALDMVLNGGFPEGAVEIIEGERTSGKSWTMLARAREFLKKHPDGIFILINAEGTNDPDFLRMLGVDTKRTLILQPDSGEQAWDAAIHIAEKAKKVYIGADSLDALVPLSEKSEDMDKAGVANAARMNNKGFRKLINAMKSDLLSPNQRVTACFICQLRTNIGQMFGDPMQAVGGKGKEFAAMQIIRMRRKTYLRTEGEKLVDKITFGISLNATVIKSKGCGEGDSVDFVIYKENHGIFKRGQIDNVTELIPFLLKYKIVKKAGAWYTFPNEDSVQGTEKMAEYLRDYPDMLEWCQNEVKEIHSKRYKIGEDETEETETPKRTRRRTRKRPGGK